MSTLVLLYDAAPTSEVQLENICVELVTLLVFHKSDTYIVVSFLQRVKVFAIFTTLEVLKLLKSKFVNELQL